MGTRLDLPRQNAKIEFAGHLLNPANRLVETKRGKTTHLTKVEQEVLLDILEANGEVVTWADFTSWDHKLTNLNHRSVVTCISQLKKKLGDNWFMPVPGVGYALSPDIKVNVIWHESLSKAAILEAAASQHTETYAGRDLLAVIKNCDDIIEMGNATAETYATKALACLNAGHEGFCLRPWTEAVEEARGAIEEALALDDKSSSAYALRGFLACSHDHAWQGAEDDLSKALDLDPHSEKAHLLYGHLLVARGEFEEGLKHIRRGVELAPANRITVSTECWMLVWAGRPYEAIQKGIQINKLFPSFPLLRLFLGWAYEADGDIERAIEEYQAALEAEFLPMAVACLGHAYARVHQARSALAMLDKLKKAKAEGKIAYVSPYSQAIVLAGFGTSKKKQCLDTLERAFTRRSSWLFYLNVDPHWDLLRQESRFKGLVQRLGLTPRDN